MLWLKNEASSARDAFIFPKGAFAVLIE